MIIDLRSTPVVATKWATGEVSRPVIGPAWYEYILSGAWLCYMLKWRDKELSFMFALFFSITKFIQ